jgi:AGZA family xanthine/uracil permease-like MFS transporter
MLEAWFGVRASGSTPAREALGGFTTFVTMAYILAVNPVFLTAAGMPLEGAIAATAIAAGLATILMGCLANYPVALASGMGMNAFFAYGLCLGAGLKWPTALGLVFWTGVVFVILTLTGVRKVLVRAVPPVIQISGSVGIGLFIALIGFEHGGLVRADPNTLLTLGHLGSLPALLTLGGTAVGVALLAAGVRTAIFWAVAAAFIGALVTGAVPAPAHWLSVPHLGPALLPGLSCDFAGALRWEYLPLGLVLLFFAIFDTLGTLMGLAHQAGLLKDGELPRIERALTADAIGMVSGALCGTSPVTTYIESGSGIAVGARTGLASVVTGLLLLLSLFAAPVVALMGQGGASAAITAPALILVGLLMVRAVRDIEWADATEAAPAFFTMLLMPLAFNISHGLAAGIIVLVIAKLAARRGRELHWLMIVLAGLFVLRYVLLPL